MAKTSRAKKRKKPVYSRTKTEDAPPVLRQIYEAWDKFCAWYDDPQNFIGKKKPTKWSKNVNIWRSGGTYPTPARIVQALEENKLATFTLEIDFNF